MKTCTHCRMEIPFAANKCPYCLEQPNDTSGWDIWNNIISALFMGLIAFVLILWIF